MSSWLDTIIEQHRALEGPLLPILHAVQSEKGCIPAAVVPDIARALNLSSAEVHGALSFYEDFHQQRLGARHVQLCSAEACQARGSRALEAPLRDAAGIDFGETRADGTLSLARVYCLGNCASGPSLRVDDAIHGQVAAEDLGWLIASDRIAMPHDTAAGGERLRLYIPGDTTACALGADALVDALETAAAQAGQSLDIVRNGSRGLFSLEPLLEVETGQGRLAFGPVAATDAPAVLAALRDDPASHPRYLGPVDDIDALKAQQRETFARAGAGDPLCIDNYKTLGGFVALQNALSAGGGSVVEQLIASGLRGRGGAAFPAGIKWQTVLKAEAGQKYIVCNADEGDSGTFADRLLMEADPYQLIEGMAIAGAAVGATRGYIYLRSEYPRAREVLGEALVRARAAGLLGTDLLGSGKTFELELRMGAGAYICGEETSLLNSLEGKRGIVRAKPPLPALEGLFGKPTVVNNVLTLAAVTTVMAKGPDYYAALGTGRSLGTLALQLAGNVARGGLYEIPFGMTLRAAIDQFGGGTASGRPLRAVQVGGPLGAYLPESQWDTPLDYEAFAELGAMLGHGGVVLFDDTVDMGEQAQFAMAFCAEESCGKCTPCRIGSVRGVEVIERIRNNEDRDNNTLLLLDLCETMEHGSLCAMGGLTPYPVRSALQHFPEDFAP